MFLYQVDFYGMELVAPNPTSFGFIVLFHLRLVTNQRTQFASVVPVFKNTWQPSDPSNYCPLEAPINAKKEMDSYLPKGMHVKVHTITTTGI